LKHFDILKKIPCNTRWRTVVLTVTVWLFLSSAALATSPTMVNVGVAALEDQVVLNARLIDGFTDDILEAIKTGVPMTYIFHIELRRDISLWNDSLISSNTVTHTIRYDSLKKIYFFTEKGNDLLHKIMTRDEIRFRQMMLSLENVPLGPLYRLNPNEKYYVQVKADLQVDRFWFPFNYLFFFVPFNSFETDWAKSSLLSIDPDMVENQEAFNAKPAPGDGPNDLKHVIRSFNK